MLQRYIMMKEQSDQHTKTAVLLPHDKLTVSAITWNLFGSVPQVEALQTLFSLPHFEQKPDLICFGTQECERSLMVSFCLESKEEWEGMLATALPSHFLAASQTMRGMHLGVLVKKTLKDYFQLERKLKLRAGGPCNSMGNKGAISVEFSVMGQNFQVINCHLAAHQTQSNRRNETITRVLQETLQKNPAYEVIFLGDFNYRIEMGKQEYNQLISNKLNSNKVIKYSQMVERDQLNQQKQLRAQFLQLFEEGAITFPPTYKIGLLSDEYHRERIPGWTDRIFHRKKGKLVRKIYDCGYNVLGCDHRPVYAIYQIPVQENNFTLHSEHMIGVRGGQNCQLI